jgi:hypothetical protein
VELATEPGARAARARLSSEGSRENIDYRALKVLSGASDLLGKAEILLIEAMIFGSQYV